MRRRAMGSKAGLLMSLMLLVACGGDSDEAGLAGTYECRLDDGTPVSTIELLDDGTGTITILTTAGDVEAVLDITWEGDGSGGSFGPGTAEEDPFEVQDGSLVFSDGLTCLSAG